MDQKDAIVLPKTGDRGRRCPSPQCECWRPYINPPEPLSIFSFALVLALSRNWLVLDYAAMQRSRTMPGPVVFALIACFIAAGCTSSPHPALTIHDSPRGTVYLERIPDSSFQATHPINLEQGTIARALRGIHVRDDKNTLQALFASQPVTKRAFSDEDADFLAPLIATAFTRAAPDQRIGFRIVQTGTPSYSQKEGAAFGSSEPPLTLAPIETTSGAFFAYGRSLHMSLVQYRRRPQKPDTIGGPNRNYPDPTGLDRRELEFLPKEAQRPDTYRVGETDSPTLVIDYELLARLPDQPAAPAPTQPVAVSPAQPSAPPASTVQEVETLKKELQEIKRQLNEQQSRKDSPKQKGKPAPAQ